MAKIKALVALQEKRCGAILDKGNSTAEVKGSVIFGKGKKNQKDVIVGSHLGSGQIIVDAGSFATI